MAESRTHDERIDALFALPPGEFVAARDRLAKELKAAGDVEAAAAVKKLRRPTVAAAAVNRLARQASSELDELLAVGRRLREAHETLLQGGGDSGFREATAARRKLVAALTRKALGFAGSSEAQRDAITDTLEAAVADGDVADAVRAGRLTKELVAPSTFGGGLAFDSGDVPDPGGGAGRRGTDLSETASMGADEALAESLRRAERLERLHEEADRTAAEAEDAAQRVAEARSEVDRLEALLEVARAEVRSAVDQERAAKAAADRAARDLKARSS